MTQAATPSTSSVSTPPTRPKVLIVGAGLGGLTLALLLEKAGIPYIVFERATAVKHLGSALLLGAPVAPLFRQLGIYDDFVERGIPFRTVAMYDENAKLNYTIDSSAQVPLVPREKINFNKRVLSIKEVESGIQMVCSDNSEYEGDIIVGADGANSSIRQSIYRTLKEKNCLPPSDATGLPYSFICLAGQTPPLDVETFPELKQENCQFSTMCGVGNKYTWVTFTTNYKTICWMVVEHLDKVSMKDNDTFKSSEWDDGAVESMCNQVRDLAVPNGPKGSTMGTLIDLTEKQLISKVTLEEKVFTTWHSGRTVLLGDAAHKFDPSGGVGATTAMHDAVCLANWINVLPSLDVAATEKIFQEYYLERYPVAVSNYESSRLFASSQLKNFKGALARFLRRHMPRWLWLAILKKLMSKRPQASFLPLVEDNGTQPAAPQDSLIKTLKILEAQGRSVQQTRVV
ncbi:hypothetical protein BGZ83_007801 [Gryganskiella cystojenkinii]|nr:hypothetical protein BGZ83_007801 [Gryganskiella cystojenkinii]